jgi:uncharacterized membrane protein
MNAGAIAVAQIEIALIVVAAAGIHRRRHGDAKARSAPIFVAQVLVKDIASAEAVLVDRRVTALAISVALRCLTFGNVR